MDGGRGAAAAKHAIDSTAAIGHRMAAGQLRVRGSVRQSNLYANSHYVGYQPL